MAEMNLSDECDSGKYYAPSEINRVVASLWRENWIATLLNIVRKPPVSYSVTNQPGTVKA